MDTHILTAPRTTLAQPATEGTHQSNLLWTQQQQLPSLSDWPLQCQDVISTTEEHTDAFFQTRMSEPQRDHLDAADAIYSSLHKQRCKLWLVVENLRYTDKPTPQATIDHHRAMLTEVHRQELRADEVLYTLKRQYSVEHKLYSAQQDHKDFLVKLQCQRPPPHPPPQLLQPHQVRQPQHMSSHRSRLDQDIMLETLRQTLSRRIGQRLDLLYFIVITENCLAHAA